MSILDNDIFEIAQFIISNMRQFKYEYNQSDKMSPLDEFILNLVQINLKHKYNRYEIEEAFEDERMKTLLAIIANEESKRVKTNQVH
jgi:hypothetical protein